MFGIIEKILIGLLISIVNASNHTKFVSLSNQKSTTQSTLTNLHPNEYTQGLLYYSFDVNLDRYVGNCNTLNDLPNKVCVPNETEDLNLSFLNMITGINESKILTTHVLCKCKCKFDSRKCSYNKNWNNDKCRCECKNKKKHRPCKKDYILKPATCICENVKYVRSIIDDSAITCDKIREETKTVLTNSKEKKVYL